MELTFELHIHSFFFVACLLRGKNLGCRAGIWTRACQCGGSGMFIPDPDFTHPGSRIQKKQQKRGWKKICRHNFLCCHKFHKIANYFSFEVLKKKIWVNFQRIIELFAQKIVNKLSKIWVWHPGSGIRDPGSEIRDPEKTYSGSRIQGSKRHRIPGPDPQHWSLPYSRPAHYQLSNAYTNTTKNKSCSLEYQTWAVCEDVGRGGSV